ncbi:MAG: hypothetical protein RBS09_08680, partial [Anaerolineaceae bacterium]|nr:hypothetical protein [Anaerolineaceae bacterium]
SAVTIQLAALERIPPHLKTSISTITVRIGKKESSQVSRLSSIVGNYTFERGWISLFSLLGFSGAE